MLEAGTGGRPSTRAAVALAAGLMGMSAAITLMFLATRAVMAVGGSCAEGGPYVVATPCPEGAPAALFLGIFVLLGSWALVGWFGPGVGGFWGSAGVLGWSGLFIALGWNFLEAGLGSGRGIDPTGLLMGGMFWAMGIVPLAWMLIAPHLGASPAAASAASAVARPAPNRLSVHTPVEEAASPAGDGPRGDVSALVAQLEHLAALRESGMLDEREYAAAKAALIREMETEA